MLRRRARRNRKFPKTLKSINNKCKTVDDFVRIFSLEGANYGMIYTMDLFKDPNTMNVSKYSPKMISILKIGFATSFPTEDFVNRCIELSDKYLYHSDHIINLLHASGYIFSDEQKQILFTKGLPLDMFDNYRYYTCLTTIANNLTEHKSKNKHDLKNIIKNMSDGYISSNFYDDLFNMYTFDINMNKQLIFMDKLMSIDTALTKYFPEIEFKVSHIRDIMRVDITELINFAIKRGFDITNPKFVNDLSIKSMILLRLSNIPISISDEKLLELSIYYTNITDNDLYVRYNNTQFYNNTVIPDQIWNVVIDNCKCNPNDKNNNMYNILEKILNTPSVKDVPIDNFETVRLLNDPSKYNIILNQLGWPHNSDQNIYIILRILGFKPTQELFQLALKLHHLVAIYDCIINFDFKMDYEMLKTFIESTKYPILFDRYNGPTHKIKRSMRRYVNSTSLKPSYEESMFTRTLHSILMQKFQIPIDFYKYIVDVSVDKKIKDIVLDSAIEYGYVTTLDNISYGFSKKYCHKNLHKLGVPMDEEFFHQMYIYDIPEILDQTWSTQQLVNRVSPFKELKRDERRSWRRTRVRITRTSPSDYYDARIIPDHYTYDLSLRYNKKIAKIIEKMPGFIPSPCCYYWKNHKSGGNFKFFCEQVGITQEMLSKQCADSFEGIVVKRSRVKKETLILSNRLSCSYDTSDDERNNDFDSSNEGSIEMMNRIMN